MRHPAVTIFLVFFGMALLDALSDGRWQRIAFWVAMAAVFILLDVWGHRRRFRPR